MYVDLGRKSYWLPTQWAEETVEIKSFLGLSTIHEFHLAVGQILELSTSFGQHGAGARLYLAIPEDIYVSSLLMNSSTGVQTIN
jgi:allophanate hydrolase subunit 2